MTTITIPARIASAGFENSPELPTAPSPASPDEPRDDHHRQREQNRLVEAEEKHPPRHGELHLQEHLAARCSHRGSRLDRVHRHPPDAQCRDANTGGIA